MRHSIIFLVVFCIQGFVRAQIANQATTIGTPPKGVLHPEDEQKRTSITMVYSSAVWRVYSEARRYEGPRHLVFRDGSRKEIPPGSMIPSARIFSYSLSNAVNAAESRVYETTTKAAPDVLTVLKDGTLVLGVQRDEYYIRFIGRDTEAVDVIAKADGVSYEPVYVTDSFFLMRSRDAGDAKQVFVVPLSEKTLDFTRRVPLSDETGRPVAVPKSTRFEQEGFFIRWHDTDTVHSFTIPKSVVEKP